MKKLVVLILAIVMCLVLMAGCGSTVKSESTGDVSMFIRVEDASKWDIVYHRETKVMYAVSDSNHNRGTFTLLVNADGSPMLWEDNNA